MLNSIVGFLFSRTAHFRINVRFIRKIAEKDLYGFSQGDPEHQSFCQILGTPLAIQVPFRHQA